MDQNSKTNNDGITIAIPENAPVYPECVHHVPLYSPRRRFRITVLSPTEPTEILLNALADDLTFDSTKLQKIRDTYMGQDIEEYCDESGKQVFRFGRILCEEC